MFIKFVLLQSGEMTEPLPKSMEFARDVEKEHFIRVYSQAKASASDVLSDALGRVKQIEGVDTPENLSGIDRQLAGLNLPPVKFHYEFRVIFSPNANGRVACSFFLGSPKVRDDHIGTLISTTQPGLRGGYAKTRGMNPSFYNADEFLEILRTIGRTFDDFEKAGILPTVSGLEQIASNFLSPHGREVTLGIDRYDPQNGPNIIVGNDMFSHKDIKRALMTGPESYLMAQGIDLRQ